MSEKKINDNELIGIIPLSHNDITGKVVGISEEKDKSTVNILLENHNMEFEASKKEYKLGETLELYVEIRAVRKKFA